MKTENIALDTGVFTLYYTDDRQGKDILESVFTGDSVGHTCELNLTEYYYKTCENVGREIAEITQRAIRTKPIHVHVPEQELSTTAASLKCDYRGKISLVDSYILAVAKRYDCRLVTTDPVLKEINVIPTSLLDVPKSKLAKNTH